MKNLTKLILLIMLVCALFLNLKCKDDSSCSTCPPIDNTPGRRDYVWTIDTLRIPQGEIFYPSRIWGSASNDVWISGSGSSTYLLWHFNGESWKRDSTPKYFTPWGLWGTASNNIWLGNDNNTFWRYNGTQWYKYCDIIPPTGFDRVTITGIWGNQPKDMMGVGSVNGGGGYKGVIMRFNGTYGNMHRFQIYE
jgi:hypothetical protein